jgi:hypothetical protein
VELSSIECAPNTSNLALSDKSELMKCGYACTRLGDRDSVSTAPPGWQACAKRVGGTAAAGYGLAMNFKVNKRITAPAT